MWKAIAGGFIAGLVAGGLTYASVQVAASQRWMILPLFYLVMPSLLGAIPAAVVGFRMRDAQFEYGAFGAYALGVALILGNGFTMPPTLGSVELAARTVGPVTFAILAVCCLLGRAFRGRDAYSR